VLNIHKWALLIAKMVTDKAQNDGNAGALARFATQYETILASAHRDRTLFCRFIVKNKRIE